MKKHCRTEPCCRKIYLVDWFRDERQEGGGDSGSYYNSPENESPNWEEGAWKERGSRNKMRRQMWETLWHLYGN